MIIKWPWTRAQVVAARPDMTRRRFLKAMATVPVAVALAPDILDMLQPPKIISLPPRMAMSGYLTSAHAWYLEGDTGRRMPMYRRSGAMLSADFRQQLAAGLNEVFSKEYERYRPDYERVFQDANFHGIGLAQVKQEGGVIAYDHVPQEYVRNNVQQTYALGFAITEEAPEESWYDALGCSKEQALAEEAARRVDEIPRAVDKLVQSVDALPAAAEDLARGIATSPIDLVRRIFRG